MADELNDEDYLTEYDEFERENRVSLCVKFAYDVMHDEYFKFVGEEFKNFKFVDEEFKKFVDEEFKKENENGK